MEKVLFIRLVSKHVNNLISLNFGAEIVKQKLIESGYEVTDCYFDDNIPDLKKHKIIFFNVLYIGHCLNFLPFLKKYNIEPNKHKRNKKQILLVGGPGLTNKILLSNYADYQCFGYLRNNIKEIMIIAKSCHTSANNYDFTKPNKSELHNKPIFHNNKAYIELTRGCKYKCKFCQYSWINRKYIEKDFYQLRDEIDIVKRNGIARINFITANFFGYSNIKNLLGYCIAKNIIITNSDMSILDSSPDRFQLAKMAGMKQINTGIESFCQTARYQANKKISDTDIFKFFINGSKYFSNFHLYFIIGLPGELLDGSTLEIMQRIKHYTSYLNNKSFRINYSFSNFQPLPFTPYANKSLLNFDNKRIFLMYYILGLYLNNYIDFKKYVEIFKKVSDNNFYQMIRLGSNYKTYDVIMKLHNHTDMGYPILEKLSDLKYRRSIDSKMYDILNT